MSVQSAFKLMLITVGWQRWSWWYCCLHLVIWCMISLKFKLTLQHGNHLHTFPESTMWILMINWNVISCQLQIFYLRLKLCYIFSASFKDSVAWCTCIFLKHYGKTEDLIASSVKLLAVVYHLIFPLERRFPGRKFMKMCLVAFKWFKGLF